ncbi:MAG: hypothetical protein ABIR04_05945 [Cypionkella sp.]
MGLIVTLATMIVAPVQEANAAVAAATSPMMQMADGAPCNSQSCAKMPDCPMALPCMSVPTGLVGLSAKLGFQPAAQIVRFAFMAHADMSSVEGGGLRRPPKI